MRNYFSPFLLTLLLLGATGSAAIAQELARLKATQDQLADGSNSKTHFNTQVQKLNGKGLIFAGAYSSAMKLPKAPQNYSGWFDGTIQGQIDRDYFRYKVPAGSFQPPKARHDANNDGAEFRWQDDYQAASKPGPETGSDGGQLRPRVKGVVQKGKLIEPITKGEIWFQYEIWFEKGMLDFAVPNHWSAMKTARLSDNTVRPTKGNNWFVNLVFKHGPATAQWKLRGYYDTARYAFAKPLTEGAWQRITVRTYDLGTPTPKVDVWHQDTAQGAADKMFDAVVSNRWSAKTTINEIVLANNSSSHGGARMPDHDFSVLWRHWIVSTQPIDLGESSIGN